METIPAPSLLTRLSGTFKLRTTLLKLGLVVVAIALPGVALAGNLTGRYATMTLDGSLSDWQPSDVMYSASEIAAGAPLASTFNKVRVANDSSFIYVALEHPAPTAITDPWITSVYLDPDMNGATGFNAGWMVGGYDRLVQYGGSGTTYSVFGFTGGTDQVNWNWGNWLGLISYSYSDYVTEWAIPLSALGMTGNQLRMEFNATGSGVTTETWAYQWESGVGIYTLATVPEPSTFGLLVLGIGGLFFKARQRRPLASLVD